MSSIIANQKLTHVESDALHAVQTYMIREAGDSHWTHVTSPRGDGREVAVDEIFPGHNNQMKAKRTTVNRLGKLGVLRACEIQLDRGMLKGVPHANLFMRVAKGGES